MTFFSFLVMGPFQNFIFLELLEFCPLVGGFEDFEVCKIHIY